MDSQEVLTGMHPTLQAGWQLAERVRGELLGLIRPVSPAQWTYRSGAGSWSIAEVVEHLLRAEIGTSKMARKLIRGDYQAAVPPAGAILRTAALDRYPYGRLTAPRELIPGSVRDRGELERELGVAHARFRTELERFRGEDPEALRAPDPATGVWHTLGGWVKLQVWHEAHHITQIQRILAAPKFPV
jgi:DinB superfamily